jgi:hypothetical protein
VILPDSGAPQLMLRAVAAARPLARRVVNRTVFIEVEAGIRPRRPQRRAAHRQPRRLRSDGGEAQRQPGVAIEAAQGLRPIPSASGVGSRQIGLPALVGQLGGEAQVTAWAAGWLDGFVLLPSVRDCSSGVCPEQSDYC